MNNYEFISLDESQDGKTKYTASFMNTNTGRMKTVKFGAYSFGDYPYWYQEKGRDYANMKKRAYIARHEVRETFDDPVAKSTLSLYILWNKPTIVEGLQEYLNTFF